MAFRSILITGASAGIGAALAQRVAGAEVTLFLGGRDTAALDRVAQACRARRARVFTRQIDVSDHKTMAGWVTDSDAVSPLDLIIANAGISGGTSQSDGEEAQARRIVDVNIGGVFNTVFPALPLMRRRRAGTIAIVSSLASFRGLPGSGAYGATKAAIRIWAETLDLENARYGMTISAICPGFVVTRMTARNQFRMIGLMDADKAADRIMRGLDRGQRRIAFPFRTYALTRVVTALPFAWSQRLLRKRPS